MNDKDRMRLLCAQRRALRQASKLLREPGTGLRQFQARREATDMQLLQLRRRMT
jgi:hypothetical protein